MNSKEILKAISKQWCGINNLVTISSFKKSKAYELKRQIENSIKDKGYFLPRGLLPMNKVVKYLQIDIDYLDKVISIEQNIMIVNI